MIPTQSTHKSFKSLDSIISNKRYQEISLPLCKNQKHEEAWKLQIFIIILWQISFNIYTNGSTPFNQITHD